MNMYKTVLIVEDDPMQLQQLETLLIESGFYILKAPDFETARRMILHEKYDLLLLDLRLGDRNGMEILELIKRLDSDFPVVILSSVSEIDEKVSAFEIGVDDYVTKPYHPAELLMRIKRLIRKSEAKQQEFQQTLDIGDVQLDLENGIVKNGNQQYFLRKKVFDLLLYLYKQRNRVMSKEQIRQTVWNDEFVEENVISVTIHEIRKVIERDPKNPKILLTVKGFGYKLSV